MAMVFLVFKYFYVLRPGVNVSLQLYLVCKSVTLDVWFLNMTQEHFIIHILASIMYT